MEEELEAKVYIVPVVLQSIDEWLDLLWTEPSKENFDDARAWIKENYQPIYQKPPTERYGPLADSGEEITMSDLIATEQTKSKER